MIGPGMRASVYGLAIDCDWPVPGGPVAPGAGIDVRVHGAWPADAGPPEAMTMREFYRSETAVDATPALVADRPFGDGRIRLSYVDGIRFLVAPDGRDVWCAWSAPLTTADATTFLLGPILGLVLRLRGELAVHASAVVHDGRAWAFVGPGGTGKSTLALALARAGFAVLTEDVLVLRASGDGWLAWPGYDHLRLWPDSPALDEGEGERSPALSPTWPKRAVSAVTAGIRHVSEPVPLAGIIFLDDPVEESLPADAGAVASPGGESRLDATHGADTIRSLVANAYMTYLLDLEAQGSQLRTLAAVASGVRAFRLAPSWAPGALPALVERLRGLMVSAVTSRRER